MVTLVDRPPPRPETLAALVSSFEKRDHAIWSVVPQYSSKHGHPIVIGREMIEAFLRAPVTSNAREIEHANQNKIKYFSIDDPLITANVDTPEQYQSLSEQFKA
jgi:molybdenum cofactor cytidylyltransferase